MRVNKLLHFVAVTCSVLIYNTSFCQQNYLSIEFRQNGELLADYNNSSVVFSNINDISNNLNNFTNNAISIDSINTNNGNVEFRNINSNEHCILELKGNETIKPNLVLYFGNNVHFDKVIGKNFNLFSINNNDNTSYCELQNIFTQNNRIFGNKPIHLHGILDFSGKYYSNVEFQIKTIKN